MLLLFVKFVTHINVESCHRQFLRQTRVNPARYRKVSITCIVALDAKDHEHIDLDGLRDVIVRQMDRLQGFAFCKGPLDGLDVLSEIHATQVDVDQL